LRAHNRAKKAVSAATRRSARKPTLQPRRAVKARAVVPVATTTSDSTSILLPLVLGAALGLSLLVAVLALTPPWALPRSMEELVYARREVLAFWGFATALGIGLALTFAVA
jgi:hypothetical protein